MDKTCLGCGQSKTLSEYYANKGRPNSRCKECKKEAQRDYNQGAGKLYVSSYREKNREKRNKQRRDWYRRLKMEAIFAYGGACACCGESHPALLCFDHVNNDGGEHRAQIAEGILIGGQVRTSPKLVVWLREYNYPPEIQLLCFNCNIGKAFNGGTCPHVGS